jgi:hypothetical protein
MADFEPDTTVVVKDMPHLLGLGTTIETPGYSDQRLTWATFKSGTICAFEPGDLITASEWFQWFEVEQHFSFMQRFGGGSQWTAEAEQILHRQRSLAREYRLSRKKVDFQLIQEGIRTVMNVSELNEAITSLTGPSTDEVLAEDFLLTKPPSDRAHFAGTADCGPDCCEAR